MIRSLVCALVALSACNFAETEDTSTSREQPPPGSVDRGDAVPSDPAAPMSGETPTADAGEPGVPAVRFVGRFDRRDPAGPTCAFPGCRIVANFEGTSVKAKFFETADDWMVGGPSEWDVAIDGQWQPKLVLERGAHAYELATGLTEGSHRVELYKRIEAQNGFSQFLGYDFGDGALLPPPPEPKRLIEVVGDSTPAGYGVEGAQVGPNCSYPSWGAKWENFHLTFGALLGERFDADVVGVAYSGKGITRNPTRTDMDTIPRLYARTNPLDPTSAHDFTSYVPDVVILMMGSNDFVPGQPYDDGPPTLGELTDAFRAFAGEVRARHASALLVFALSPSVSNYDQPGRDPRTNVLTAMTHAHDALVNAGDTNVMMSVPTSASPDEVTGCAGHGTPGLHARIAEELGKDIAVKMGW